MRLDSVCSVLAIACGGPVLACAPPVSHQPFANSVPDGVNVYLYGAAHAKSARQRPPEVLEKRDTKDEESAQSKQVSRSATRAAKRKKAKETTAQVERETEPDIAGEYRGTDWVTISLPGLPENEQEDDKARVVIKRLGDPSEGDAQEAFGSGNRDQAPSARLFSLSVIDTNSGDELCTIQGELKESVIEFKPGQVCFSGILGVPMQAKTRAGEAHVDGSTLSAEFTVELRVKTPDTELEGTLDYSFEGERAD